MELLLTLPINYYIYRKILLSLFFSSSNICLVTSIHNSLLCYSFSDCKEAACDVCWDVICATSNKQLSSSELKTALSQYSHSIQCLQVMLQFWRILTFFKIFYSLFWQYCILMIYHFSFRLKVKFFTSI